MQRRQRALGLRDLELSGGITMEKGPNYTAVRRSAPIELLVLGLLTALIMVLAIPLVSQATNASDIGHVERSNIAP